MDEIAIHMEKNRAAFSFFSDLCVALKDFAYNENEKTTQQL